jgi:hypothetical protein
MAAYTDQLLDVVKAIAIIAAIISGVCVITHLQMRALDRDDDDDRGCN